MILDWDKNNNPIIWNGNNAWHDLHGFDVTSTKVAHFEQRGQITGINIAATGIQTAPVLFSTPYTNNLDEVFVEFLEPSATDAIIGGWWISGDTKTGFTLNVHVTTASVTAGSTMKANWKSLGQ